MNNINQTALNMHNGLRWGLCTLEECIHFAEQLIAANESAPYEMIALSMSKTLDEAMSEIKPLIQGADKKSAIRFALGRMHYLGTLKPERLINFANILCLYAIQEELDTIDGFELLTMDDEYVTAELTGSDNEFVDIVFIEALSRFQSDNSHRSDWFAV